MNEMKSMGTSDATAAIAAVHQFTLYVYMVYTAPSGKLANSEQQGATNEEQQINTHTNTRIRVVRAI